MVCPCSRGESVLPIRAQSQQGPTESFPVSYAQGCKADSPVIPGCPSYRARPRPFFFFAPDGVLMGSGAVTSGTGMTWGADSSISSTVVLGLKASKGENFTGLQGKVRS